MVGAKSFVLTLNVSLTEYSGQLQSFPVYPFLHSQAVHLLDGLTRHGLNLTQLYEFFDENEFGSPVWATLIAIQTTSRTLTFRCKKSIVWTYTRNLQYNKKEGSDA